MRACANINAFTVCLGLFAIVYGSFDTYLISMLTTLERRFSLPSKLSGVLQGSSDFGYLLGVLPISYFGRSSHRPRTLGALGLLLAAGILVMCTPYFLFGPLQQQQQQQQQPTESLGDAARFVCNATYANGSAAAAAAAAPSTAQNSIAYAILVLGAFTVGVGSTPFWNLGLAYIDDHVTKVRAPMYISAMMALRFVAPLPGYVVGGQIAGVPEDLGAGHSGVGAWWLGFLGLSAAIASCSLTMFCFPRHLPRPVDCDVELDTDMVDIHVGDGDGVAAASEAAQVAHVSLTSIAALATGGFFETLARLFRNVTFLALLTGAAIEFLAFMGFLAFLPKYYQVGFGTTEGVASLCAGVVEGLSSAIGTLAGGVFMNRTTVSLGNLLGITAVICMVAGGLGNIGAVLRCRSTAVFVSAATAA